MHTRISEKSCHLFQSVDDWSSCIHYSVKAWTVTYAHVLSPNDKPVWYFTRMNNQKRELAKNDANAIKESHDIRSEIQIEQKWSCRQNCWCGNVDMPLERLLISRQELRESQLININEEICGCPKGNDTSKKTHIKITFGDSSQLLKHKEYFVL